MLKDNKHNTFCYGEKKEASYTSIIRRLDKSIQSRPGSRLLGSIKNDSIELQLIKWKYGHNLPLN